MRKFPINKREDFLICPICGECIELNVSASPIGDVEKNSTPEERWFCVLEGQCSGCESSIMLSDYFPTAAKGIDTLVSKARDWWNSRIQQGEEGESDD